MYVCLGNVRDVVYEILKSQKAEKVIVYNDGHFSFDVCDVKNEECIRGSLCFNPAYDKVLKIETRFYDDGGLLNYILNRDWEWEDDNEEYKKFKKEIVESFKKNKYKIIEIQNANTCATLAYILFI